MSEPPIIETVEDGLCVLTLNRPEVRNAIDFSTAAALERAVAHIEVNDSARALVIVGSGHVFASGGDLRQFSTLKTADAVREMSLRMREILRRLESVPIPTVAAMNGPAIGGGAELALACDTRVMAPESYIQFPQTSLGIITGWSGGQRLQRLLGYSRAAEILFSAGPVDPDRALHIGLVNAVLHEPFKAQVEAYARRLMGGTRAANAAIKRALLLGQRLPVAEAAEAETELFVERWVGPEREALMARHVRSDDSD